MGGSHSGEPDTEKEQQESGRADYSTEASNLELLNRN